MMKQQNSIDMLRNELALRLSRNVNYSMRSFAKDISLSPSHLSNFFNFKAGLSIQKAKTITQKLKWDAKKSHFFIKAVSCEFSRSDIQRKIAQRELNENSPNSLTENNIDLLTFQFVSGWHYFAILELFKLKNFQLNNDYIAKELGINNVDVENAIKTMTKLKLLKIKNGQLAPSEDYSMIGDNVTSKAIRKFHSEIIRKAFQSIEEQSIHSRVLRSTLVSIRKDKFEEASLYLQEFHDKFCEKISIEDDERADHVYCLSSQFFKITRNE